MHELLLTELFNRPHLVEAGRLDALAAYMLSRDGFNMKVPEQPEPQAFTAPDSATRSENGYYIDSGVAIIDMVGTMVHRGSWMGAVSGLESYTTIARRLGRAMNDASVKAVLLNIDSPGGAVAGAFDLADKLHAMRGTKPIEVIAADRMASAAYLIGSGADRVHTTQTGQVGSIGVVMKHLDISRMNEKSGITPTYIFAGSHKVEGNPDEPLSKEVLARFQTEVDQLYSMFVSVVVRNRAMTEKAVVDTQAAVFLGADASEIGLADSVTTGDALLEQLKTKHGAARPLFSSTIGMEKNAMSEKEEKPGTSAKEEQGGTAQAVAEGTEIIAAVEKGVSEKRIRAEERQRFAAIMTSDSAQGRTKAAVHLATKTDMSAEDVIATLADVPIESKVSKLDQLMAGEGTPGIGAEEFVNDKAAAEAVTVSAIAAGMNKHR